MDFTFLLVTIILIIFLIVSYYLRVIKLSTPLLLIYLIFCFTYLIDNEENKNINKYLLHLLKEKIIVRPNSIPPNILNGLFLNTNLKNNLSLIKDKITNEDFNYVLENLQKNSLLMQFMKVCPIPDYYIEKKFIIIRKEILDDSALEMFWFIDEKIASGGRAALFPVIKAIFSTKSRKTKFVQMDNICSNECKSAKAVFVRSFTLITNSKKLAYRKSK